MELYDALSLPLAPPVVWEALHNPALVRASLDHCESVARRPSGEYALALTVPLGPLRSRYEVRAHIPPGEGTPPVLHRVISFRARSEGVGSLRGQIDITLRGEPSSAADAAATRVDYTVWAALAGPLETLPSRQIEKALRDLADQFFVEFCAVVAAREGIGPNRVAPRLARRHVFLRPQIVAGAMRRPHRPASAGAAHGGILRHAAPGILPMWGWAAMIVFVALLLYLAGRMAG